MSDEDINPELDFLGLGATVRGFVPGRRLLDRYVLHLVLDWSKRGVSWLAFDELLQKEVEIKFLPESVRLDAVSHEEISQAAHHSSQLVHPHIARLHDFCGDDTFAAISMEYVDGDTLSAWRQCQPTGLFEVAHIHEWTMQLLDALDYAHVEAKFIHGELNPYTLLGDEGGALKIADFGVARAISDSLLRTSGRAGLTDERLVYMSPQMIAGESPSVQDDIYSLGATLYELLTGKPPFLDDGGDLLDKINFEVPPYMAQRQHALGVKAEPIPDEWELTIAACLVKQPAARPKSIAAVAERLGYKVAPIKVTTTKPAPPPPLLPTPSLTLVRQLVRKTEAKEEPAIEAKVESKVEPKVEAIVERKVGPKVGVKGERKIGPRVQVKVERKIGPRVEVTAERKAQPAPAPNKEPAVEAKVERKSAPAIEIQPLLELEPVGETKVESKLEPAVELRPLVQPEMVEEAKIESNLTPAAEVLPAVEAEVKPKLESAAEPKAEPKPNPAAERKLLRRVERKVEPKPEPEEIPPLQPPPIKRLGKDRLLTLCLLVLLILDGLGFYFFWYGPEAERTRQAELAVQAATAESEKRKADQTAAMNEEEKAILIQAKQEAEARAEKAEQEAQQAKAEAEKTKQSALQELSTAMSPVIGRPWINSQGVKFVPAGTEGVLFSVWDVRVKDYAAFVKETGHEWPKPGFAQTENDPAVMVSWDDAKAFCDWLTKKEQAEGRLNSNQAYRLPVDVEWSKAVGLNEPDASTPRDRNVDVRNVFPWGIEWFPPNMAGNYAELLTHDGFAKTSPVGTFRANGYGLYDMGGNVWQWCEDKYDYVHGWRVLRGASWVDHDEETLYSSCRSAADPDARDGNSGFRMVLVVAP
jgi:serine/threonine protein kinase/formylglycine-generating enzyme required for sulfatase activity